MNLPLGLADEVDVGGTHTGSLAPPCADSFGVFVMCSMMPSVSAGEGGEGIWGNSSHSEREDYLNGSASLTIQLNFSQVH